MSIFDPKEPGRTYYKPKESRTEDLMDLLESAVTFGVARKQSALKAEIVKQALGKEEAKARGALGSFAPDITYFPDKGVKVGFKFKPKSSSAQSSDERLEQRKAGLRSYFKRLRDRKEEIKNDDPILREALRAGLTMEEIYGKEEQEETPSGSSQERLKKKYGLG